MIMFDYSVSQSMLTLAAGGILLSLMGAHFCKGWNILVSCFVSFVTCSTWFFKSFVFWVF